MAHVTKAITANAYRNKGGTILFGGAVSVGTDAPYTQTLGTTVLNPGKAKHGSAIAVSVPKCVAKSITANAIATMTAGKYVVLGFGTTQNASSVLVNTTSLTTGITSIHQSITKHHYPVTSYAYATGVATKGSVQHENYAMSGSGNDNAANPTLAIPGEFTYHQGKPAGATSADYPARTHN